MTSPTAGTSNRSALSPDDGPEQCRSRSPHPYHRQSISLSRKDADELATFVLQDAEFESSTERGTEADDEKGPILRALPAPPLKARKGWKGSKSPLDRTPLVTPLLSRNVSEEGLTYFDIQKEKRENRQKDQQRTQAADRERYKRYVARRRGEVVRRITETTLMLCIAAMTCHKARRSNILQPWRREIIVTTTILGTLCLLYPIRLTLLFIRRGSSVQAAIKSAFHIPSRFDPGPLLYPVLVPFCIALSLGGAPTPLVLINLILGLASTPDVLIPKAFSSSSIVYWTLCLVVQGRKTGPGGAGVDSFLGNNSQLTLLMMEHESLSLLLPLHETLLAILKFLTTTSLDPAELQLLSAGLINLLLFATSPQAQILRIIIWAGSMCLFLACRKPLAWEVTLARIPTWKFARNKSPKNGLLSKLDGLIYLIIPSDTSRRHVIQLDSDDEDYEHLRSARKRAQLNGRASTTKMNQLSSDIDKPISFSQASVVDREFEGLTRSVTLPEQRQLKSSRSTSITLPRAGFLSLTYAQAQALKWSLAFYVYGATITIIMIGLRPYIGSLALHSHEPFGWALGYLFGNIAPLRYWIVSHNLERWIALPQHAAHVHIDVSTGWLDRYRQTQQGSANVRLILAGYCLLVLFLGLITVFRLGIVVEVDTRRKVFHGIMVAMLLPTIPIDPCFIALALTIILAIFLLLDLFRASQVPPISKPLTTFLAPYVDGRDHRGPVIISHIFLLIGCAIPLWLALAGTQRFGQEPWVGWDATTRDLSMISGVVCVGMGDAAASLFGRRYGRTKWFWGGGKSIEGSCAFVVAVTVGLMASYMWLRIGGWLEWDTSALPQATMKALIAASGASLLESVLTAANDNVVVPVGLWLLVRGLDL